MSRATPYTGYRIEYADNKVDDRGRRQFTLFWWTDYTPSKPYPHERAEVFFANPAKYAKGILNEPC